MQPQKTEQLTLFQNVANATNTVFDASKMRELPSHPEFHKQFMESHDYTFFEDPDVFNNFFDSIEMPSEETKRVALQNNFFLARLRQQSLLSRNKNLGDPAEILKKHGITFEKIEIPQIQPMSYSKITIVETEEDYFILGLKQNEADKFGYPDVNYESILIAEKFTYYKWENTSKIFLVLLQPTVEIKRHDLLYDAVIAVGKQIIDEKFGAEAEFDASSMMSVFDLMALKNISDLHFNSDGEKYAVIQKEDGSAKKIASVKTEQIERLVTQIKSFANEDEFNEQKEVKRAVRHIVSGERRDYRLSIKKDKLGHKCAFRLLPSERFISDLTNLNYPPSVETFLQGLVEKESGMQKGFPGFCISGATGQGKSTTAYTIMKELLKNKRMITEIGNPVEIIISNEYITQYDLSDTENAEVSQRDTLIDLMSTAKRQDPDIIYITEVRTREEKQKVFELSAHGHGVVFTMHTNSVWSTIEDLSLNLGSENKYKIGQNLFGIMNKKLIPSVCPRCRGTGERGGGKCTNCSGAGEKGRVPIAEVWQRRKIGHNPLSEITKENYTDSAICSLYISFEQSLMEQLKLGRITQSRFQIEMEKFV